MSIGLLIVLVYFLCGASTFLLVVHNYDAEERIDEDHGLYFASAVLWSLAWPLAMLFAFHYSRGSSDDE